MTEVRQFRCDLCGEFRDKATLLRLGVRAPSQRAEDAEIVDVCPGCLDRPVSDVKAEWGTRDGYEA